MVTQTKPSYRDVSFDGLDLTFLVICFGSLGLFLLMIPLGALGIFGPSLLLIPGLLIAALVGAIGFVTKNWERLDKYS
ncbi:MAG: hypothetical protein HY455_01735 [Parcubacteria group bacterium]|nr:hypothetical protein [Parcubacteria group bacterium]